MPDRGAALAALRPADRAFFRATQASALAVLAIFGGVLAILVIGSLPAMRAFGPEFLFTQRWAPQLQPTPVLGALGPLYGTLVTSLIALVIATPIGLGVAIFLTEFCPPRARRPIGMAVELLAGVPSIIYGMWGFFILAPLLVDYAQPALIAVLGGLPLVGALFSGPPSYLGLFTAGVVLAIMIIPFIAAIARDVFATVPPMLRESAYGLGCTTWEVVRRVVIPYCRVGLVGAVMLALGRALGETMAVTFIVGNSCRVPGSIFAPGSTISAAIASEFAESDGLHQSALLLLALLLFALTFAVLAVARLMLARLARGAGG